MKQYTLSVQEIRKETKDAITLSFKQPGLRKIKYQAGQYITLIVRINGRKYARPYSFSSAPSIDSALEVTVKRVPDGIVSNYINNDLKVGDVLEILEPMGDFTYKSINPIQSIFLWGIGSGITPLFSIIKEALCIQPNNAIHLIYGNKNVESTIFREQLNFLKQENSAVFNMTNFYSQFDGIDESNAIQKGRISSEFVTHMAAKHKNLKESLHYICGPRGLKNTINSSLLELKVPSSSIFIEEFELIIDPNELEGVEDSKVIVLFEGKQSEIFVPKGKSILDVALDNDIEIPYSCQTGNCNTCKAKLKEGQLRMLELSKIREDLAQDEFLLCCSYPLTNSVRIEVIRKI
jgi:ring-1,2-phenylacetyl-CoA epoxidase subunit PaaE